MSDLIKLIPSNIEIEYFQIDAQGHDLNVINQEPTCIAPAALTRTQVVKSARHFINRIARVMLEVDVVKGPNPFFVGGSNKQVALVRQRRRPLLGRPPCLVIMQPGHFTFPVTYLIRRRALKFT
jgi:hypothetical protein